MNLQYNWHKMEINGFQWCWFFCISPYTMILICWPILIVFSDLTMFYFTYIYLCVVYKFTVLTRGVRNLIMIILRCICCCWCVCSSSFADTGWDFCTKRRRQRMRRRFTSICSALCIRVRIGEHAMIMFSERGSSLMLLLRLMLGKLKWLCAIFCVS